MCINTLVCYVRHVGLRKVHVSDNQVGFSSSLEPIVEFQLIISIARNVTWELMSRIVFTETVIQLIQSLIRKWINLDYLELHLEVNKSASRFAEYSNSDYFEFHAEASESVSIGQ